MARNTEGLTGSDHDFQLMIGVAQNYLTVSELADLLRVSQPTVRRWTDGHNLPMDVIRRGYRRTLDPLLGYHEFLKGVKHGS